MIPIICFVIGLLGSSLFRSRRTRDRKEIDRLLHVVAEKQALLEESERRRLDSESLIDEQDELLLEVGLSIENHLVVFQTLQEHHAKALINNQELAEDLIASKCMEKELQGIIIELEKRNQQTLFKSTEHLQAHEKTLSIFN